MARNSKPRRKPRIDREDSKGRKFDDKSPERESRRLGPENDVSWYSKYPNLLIAAGSLPYPYRPGMDLNFGIFPQIEGVEGGPSTRKMTIPGVMVLDWMPSIGISNKATDPASVLGKEMYSAVRKVYSGSLEADAPDYVMYVMALDSIFSYIAWLKRLYRLLVVWTPDNYMLPDIVIGSMGLTLKDIQSLRQDRTKLWQLINELVLQSRKFTCPAGMDIINRHYWMSDNVYTDEQSINSQFYLFNLHAVYKFSMVNSAQGDPAPGLVMVPILSGGNGVITAESLYTFGLSLIEALVAWDDAYTINGYLKRAYEGSPMFMVDELPLDQPFTPVYVPEVLMQIENSRTIPMGHLGLKDYNGLSVSQDILSNAVVSNPTVTYVTNAASDKSMANNMYVHGIKPMLSIRSDTPTVADSVVASRLQCTVTRPSVSNVQVEYVVHAATEIPMVWRYMEAWSAPGFSSLTDRTTILRATSLTQFPTIDATGTAPAYPANLMLNVFKIAQFDWHPFLYYTYVGKGSPTTPLNVQFSVVGDTHNATLVENEVLDNLHKVCLFSEFNSFSM